MKTPLSRALLGALLATALVAGCAESPSRESTGQYLDDATITTKVKSELLAKEGVSSTDISVETRRGEVQLGGFAKSKSERRQAAEVARSVAGVKSVHNDILVR